MKAVFTLICSVFLLYTADAQFSENFDQDIATLTGKCWSVNNVNYTTTASDVINGTGSVYTNPPTSTSGLRTITTPFLNVNSNTLSVSFKYKTSSKIGGNSTRTIEIVLVDKYGASTSLQTITMDKNSPTTVLTLSNTYAIATPGVYRLELRIGGATGDGNSRVIFDDLYASASPYYASFCNTPATAVNDTYSAVSPNNIIDNVLSNDNFPADGETYTASLVTAPSAGTLVLNPDGTFTYTPPAGFSGGTITFTYQVIDNGYAPATSNVATVTLNYSAPVLLPVTLTDVNATKVGNAVKVSWTADDNASGDYFIVEKSTDGKTFAPAMEVNADGASGTRQYTATDALSSGTVYYRIRIVNQDHSVSYSKVVIVKDGAPEMQVTLLNNPATTALTLALTTRETMNTTVKIYSISGAQVYAANLNAAQGNNRINVPVQQLRSGTYVAVVGATAGKKALTFVKR